MLNHHHVNNTCDLIVYAKSIENNRTASDCMQCARVGNHTSNVCGNTFRFQSCCGFNVFCFKKPDDLRFFVHYMDWLMLTTTKQPPTPTQSHTHKHSHSDRLICKFTFNSYCPCGVGVLFLANMKSDMVLRFDWFCMIFTYATWGAVSALFAPKLWIVIAWEMCLYSITMSTTKSTLTN